MTPLTAPELGKVFETIHSILHKADAVAVDPKALKAAPTETLRSAMTLLEKKLNLAAREAAARGQYIFDTRLRTTQDEPDGQIVITAVVKAVSRECRPPETNA